ncbi:MAG: lysophospholipid acyltransferase family protein [Mycobacterium sp.]
MEPVYRGIEITAAAAARVLGTRITYQGMENIPAHGGAVVAMNHISYIDYLPAGLATRQRRRRIRYMLKAEMLEVRSVDWIIRHTRCIPVDRSAGAGAYAEAVRALRDGELVGVFPEATISRSFELKEFKSGAARMALEARVPIVPLIIWGSQRMWTKDHPKALGRNKIPWIVRAGRPLAPQGTVADLDAALRAEMTTILHEVQEQYPHPAGAFWVPRRLGGGAPSPEEARQMEAAERAERARRAAERH